MARLDDVWLLYVYWHPRDKDGAVKIAPKGKGRRRPETRRDTFLREAMRAGWPAWYAEQHWDDAVAEAEAKKAAKKAAKQAKGKRG